MDSFFVDGTLYNGRPTGESARLERERETYDLLEQLGIEFCRVDHDAANTIADCEEIDRILGVRMCKNLFLSNRQGTQFYLLLLPGEKPFVTKDFAKALGIARTSFADAAHMREYLGVDPGAVTVLGLMHDKGHDVRLVIDRAALEGEFLGCHPCVNTSSVRISVSDLVEKFLPHTGHAPTLIDL